MTVFDKVKWVLGILVVFFLIVSTNLIDSKNFAKVKESVGAIYEDRLVAKDLVYELSLLIQEKEIALAKSDSSFYDRRVAVVNNEIQDLLVSFLETKLTKPEAVVFHDLESNLQKLQTDEANYYALDAEGKVLAEKHLDEVKKNLHELSKIQMEEGRKQLFISKKAMDSVELFTQMEIFFLIILAIAIQIIILYNPKPSKD